MIPPMKWFSKSYVFEKFSKNPANMLVVTGVLGWVLSSAAQIFAIAINDKISPKEKMFLIPQEIADAVVNCVSFYTVTSGVKYIGKKLTNTAKLRTDAVSKLLKDRGLILEKGAERVKNKVYAGDWNFDITKLPDYESKIESVYKPFNNGAEVIASLVGSIISSNLITPIFRNHYAAKKQKELMSYNKKNTQQNLTPFQQKVSFADYQKLVYSRPKSGNLKV